MQHHLAIRGIDGKGQHIIINMTVFKFFRRMCHPFCRMQFIDIERNQAFGEEHQLGVKQLINVIGGLLPRDKTRCRPGNGSQNQKDEGKPDAQAEPPGHVDASPSV